MDIRHDRQAGFGLLLTVIFVVVVVGAIGIIGWQLYSRSLQGTTQHSPSQQADKYAGWKAYCSSLGGICFKYPSDWRKTEISGSDPASAMVTITSPSKFVEVAYSPVVVGTGGHCKPNTCFLTAESITPLGSSQTSNLTVVKGVYTNKSSGAVLAYYFLGSDDKLAPYNLKVNQSVDVGFFADPFTSPLDSSATEELRVKSVPDDGFTSAAGAQAWLAKPEVATAGSILSSVYLNKTKQ